MDCKIVNRLLPLAVVAAFFYQGAAAFGDNAFGAWVADATGAPALAWRGGCPATASAVCPGNQSIIHAAGNDRASAIVFSDGTVSMRQDEGGPKLLSSWDPANGQFRGGLGYLSNATSLLAASVVDGALSANAAVNLTLGVGYVVKLATNADFVVSHAITAPFGDDSVLLITVDADVPARSAGGALRWTEAWSALVTEFGGAGSATFVHNVSGFLDTDGALLGLLNQPRIAANDSQRSAGPQQAAPTPSDHDEDPRPSFLVCLSCAASAPPAGPGEAAGRLAGVTSRALSLFPTNASSSAASPALAPLTAGLDNDTTAAGADALLALQLQLETSPSAPAAAVRLALLYGYLKPGEEGGVGGALAAVARRVAAYAPVWPRLRNASACAWAAAGAIFEPRNAADGPAAAPMTLDAAVARAGAASGTDLATCLEAPAPPPPAQDEWVAWEGREMRWHSYMLRGAGLSFDSFYGQHTLNQGGNYLWQSQSQAAARDPLAHVMALSSWGRGASRYVLEVLAYTLAEKRTVTDAAGRPAGSIPWGRRAFGRDASQDFDPSDLEVALLFTLSQYVLSTRDVGALDRVAFPWNGTVTTLGAAAAASYAHLTASPGPIGLGAHGLLRLKLSDHNDGLLGALGVAGANATLAVAAGESVMNSAFAAYVLPQYAAVLRLAGQDKEAAEVLAFSAGLRAAVDAAYSEAPSADGGRRGWYKRVWLGSDALGWRGDAAGDGTMWTETQSWALLAGVPALQPNRTAALLAAIEVLARTPSPIGALNTPPAAFAPDYGVGYGGVWFCGNTALVAALGAAGASDAALDEWRKNALAAHAAAYPDMYLGLASGPDVYASVLAARPGTTRCHWNDPGLAPPCNEAAYPLHNLWSHTLPAFALPALAGIEWGSDDGGDAQLTVRPQAATLAAFAIFTPLVSVLKGSDEAAVSAAPPPPRRGSSGTAAAEAEVQPPSCAYRGHYAPYAAAGTPLSVRVYLRPADLAACAPMAAVNGAPVPLSMQADGAVLLRGTTQALPQRPQQAAPMRGSGSEEGPPRPLLQLLSRLSSPDVAAAAAALNDSSSVLTWELFSSA